MNDIPMIYKQEWQHPGIDGSRHLFIAVNELWLSLADGFLLISHLQNSGVEIIHLMIPLWRFVDLVRTESPTGTFQHLNERGIEVKWILKTTKSDNQI